MAWRRPDPYVVLLLAIIAAFVAFKFRYLGLPLFWDEAWVYAPAVRAMNLSGPGLLPDSVGPELTRGHPLMFHFICSLWTRVFGVTQTSLHSFALAVSVALLIVVYLFAVRLGSKQVGLASVLMIVLSEMFLAQSGILLPEMLLALFCLFAVFFYLSRKPWLYACAIFCALMTKESALVLVLAIVVWLAFRILVETVQKDKTSPWRWLLITSVPLLATSLFYVYQKANYGWFFYPEHIGMMTWDLGDITYKLKLFYTELFEEQGHLYSTYAFAFLVPIAWRGWNRRWAPVLLLLYATAVKILFGRWPVPSPLTIPTILLCLGLAFWIFFRPYYLRTKGRGEAVSIAFIFTIGFLGFSSLNFFTDRYLLCVVPFIALGFLLTLESALIEHHVVLFPSLALLLSAILFSQIGKHDLVRDTTLSYVDAIAVEEEGIRFLEEQNLYEDVIHGSFLEQHYLTNPGAGYLSSSLTFDKVRSSVSDSTAFAIYTSTTPEEMYDRRFEFGFVLARRFERGNAWCEVFRRLPTTQTAAPPPINP